MDSRIVTTGFFLALSCAAGAGAADLDQMDGQQLYNKECSVCHGNMAQKTGDLMPERTNRRPVQVAAAATGTRLDYPAPLTSEWGEAPAHALAGERLAVVPIYGPPLAGILGKPAGTFSGYAYSSAFLKKMNGVTWDEANLDAWIKSSQAVVSGSFMFYSQKKPGVRSKIVEYLKNQ